MVDTPAPNTANSQTTAVNNQQIPPGGPKTIPLLLDFSLAGSYIVDFTMQVQLGKIEYVQGLYCDNSTNPNPLVITNQTTGQIVTWPAYSQGYLPFFASNPPKFTAATTIGNVSVEIYAYNMPLPAFLWVKQVILSGTVTTSDTILDATVSNNKVNINDKSAYTALGYQQITSLSAATALTVPVGATLAIIVCEAQAVRYRDDGTNPTATVGMPMATGAYLSYNASLAAIKFIEQTSGAKLNVSYYS